jgi:hypothetical protein
MTQPDAFAVALLALAACCGIGALFGVAALLRRERNRQ